ncbi:GcrA family cell cycle regulator [Labrys wisconsinensis]|uniref:GcrA cell cycle regulator n=1 Tax=Labrys wisconsinensis TaxID=425677 RepID=A0ABU0JET7_9HYPH|nr:GcrA family cell cycle regulator [Labrys wisconsinensis]MDQ0472794.1 hypothetical protein [Labrys wisconsinensis]
MTVKGWTEERKQTAKTMWLSGQTAAAIAAELDCGVSRNAVIGMMQRLLGTGAKPRKQPKPAPVKKVRPSRTSPRSTKVAAGWDGTTVINGPVAEVVPPLVEQPPEPRTFWNLRLRDCHRPLWHHLERPSVDAMLFCGKPVVPGSSWCPACAVIVYQQGTA